MARTVTYKCSQCKEHKEREAFGKDKSAARGFAYRCFDCQKAHYEANKERYKEKRLRYAKNYRLQNRERLAQEFRDFRKQKTKTDPEGFRKLRYRYMQKYKDNNALKTSCRMKYDSAIAMGKLVREPCVICGELKTDGHHADYTKPLDVMWLCRSHHLAWHRVFKVEQDA